MTPKQFTPERHYWTIRILLKEEEIELLEGAMPDCALLSICRADLTVMQANAADGMPIPDHDRDQARKAFYASQRLMLTSAFK